MTRTIVFALFEEFQLLDASGPIAAFEIAGRLAPGAYRQRLAALQAGRVVSSAGVALEAGKLGRLSGIDTLIVVGGDGTRRAGRDPKLLAYLRRAAPQVRRMASVCSGALLLAEAGLLDGRRATTHWSRAAQLQLRHPKVRVEPDRIWVRDGKFWTSAGISAGIDLALAMIREDLGDQLARDVARQLVVYAERPGGQTQHSQLLELGAPDSQFAALNAWLRERLHRDLRVEVLAQQMKMSPRTFARAYVADTGVTPAKAVERLRVEAARALIESRVTSLHDVALQTGFGDVERMRRAFVRLFGTPPASLRRQRQLLAARSSPTEANTGLSDFDRRHGARRSRNARPE
jgi:transcriptional regulator GlxA family with amidase domain